MPRFGSSTLALPSFSGATRRLVLANLAGFFLTEIRGFVPPLAKVLGYLVLVPAAAVHGFVWQIATYSLINQGLLSTLFNLLTLWMIGSYLETAKGARWLYEAYFLCVVGGAVMGTAFSYTHLLRMTPLQVVAGPSSAIFGLLVAFAVFFGEQEFLMFFLVSLKAKYLVAIYLLIAVASLIGGVSPLTYLVYLSGALIGFLYARSAPGRGFSFSVTEQYFGLRNNYYRWKRRRAARKFEVYMGKHGRAVHFDKDGRFVDPDTKKGPRDPNDRRWMN